MIQQSLVNGDFWIATGVPLHENKEKNIKNMLLLS